MPKLKSKGIRHLVKLITVEGYIPKYNYSKLNYLAATIEANRKKLEAPKKAKEPTSKSSDEAAMGADSSKKYQEVQILPMINFPNRKELR